MTVQGGEWSASIGGILRFTYGSNKYDGGANSTMNQTTNYYFLGNPFVNVRFEDDSDDLGWTFLPGMDHASASADKFRTSAGEINFFGRTAGFKLMTGEKDGIKTHEKDGITFNDEKNVHRLGLIYGGVNGKFGGYNSEGIRNLLQNKWIHQPRGLNSWDVLDIPDRGYWQQGSSGGSSLWY